MKEVGDMENCILILSVGAVFIFGYFIMKKVDIFLAENQAKHGPSASTLRIGFETPVMIDSMSALLERFSRKNPNCEIYLFYGSANEIKSGVENQDLDLGVIEDLDDERLKKEVRSLTFSVRQKAITSEAAGLMVQPLNKTEKQTKVIWESDNNHMKEVFLEILRTAS